MENYENLGTIGEGTYGVVLKCRHKETGQIVAIKKFKESDEDEQVRKTALREVRILKQLKHENIVNLIEVFRRKGKLYLVFEYVERTILEELEKNPHGMDPMDVKRHLWQLLRSIEYCHSHNIIHRDIKPENLLVSKHGALKLCDFGFARTVAGPGAKYTDYVATRWYRAPELLVGDQQYGRPVDVWAIGCIFAEMMTGAPLFPGESDIDQIFHIVKCLGQLTPRQMELFVANPLYVGIRIPEFAELNPLETRFPHFPSDAISIMKNCLAYEPDERMQCSELVKHTFFDGCHATFEAELRAALEKDSQLLATIKKRSKLKRTPSTEASGATSAVPAAATATERSRVTSDGSEHNGRLAVLAGVADSQDMAPSRKPPAPQQNVPLASPPAQSQEDPDVARHDTDADKSDRRASELERRGDSRGRAASKDAPAPAASSSNVRTGEDEDGTVTASSRITSFGEDAASAGPASPVPPDTVDPDPGHLPNLTRPTTPKAARLLAFPHLTYEPEGGGDSLGRKMVMPQIASSQSAAQPSRVLYTQPAVVKTGADMTSQGMQYGFPHLAESTGLYRNYEQPGAAAERDKERRRRTPAHSNPFEPFKPIAKTKNTKTMPNFPMPYPTPKGVAGVGTTTVGSSGYDFPPPRTPQYEPMFPYRTPPPQTPQYDKLHNNAAAAPSISHDMAMAGGAAGPMAGSVPMSLAPQYAAAAASFDPVYAVAPSAITTGYAPGLHRVTPLPLHYKALFSKRH